MSIQCCNTDGCNSQNVTCEYFLMIFELFMDPQDTMNAQEPVDDIIRDIICDAASAPAAVPQFISHSDTRFM